MVVAEELLPVHSLVAAPVDKAPTVALEQRSVELEVEVDLVQYVTQTQMHELLTWVISTCTVLIQ